MIKIISYVRLMLGLIAGSFFAYYAISSKGHLDVLDVMLALLCIVCIFGSFEVVRNSETKRPGEGK